MGSKSRLSPSDITRLIRMKADAALNSNDTSSLTPAASRHSIVSNIPRGVTSGQYSLITQFFGIRPPPPPPIFSPSDIDGLYMWLDGADLTSMTLSGSQLTGWRDKSANSNNLTVTGGTGPTLSATSGNPKGVDINFNGSNQYIRSNSVTPPGTQALSVFLVFKNSSSNAGGNGRIIAGITNGPEATDVTGFRISNNSTETNSVTIQKAGEGTTHSLAWNQYHIVVVEFNGVNVYPIYFDGSLFAQYGNPINGDTTFTFNRFGLGASLGNSGNSFTPGTFWAGALNEVIIYRSVLTTARRQQIEGYLAEKWGLLRLLPSTHPYYSLLSIPSIVPSNYGVALWLDASDSASVTLSGATNFVTQWTDKSGYGNHAVQTRAGSRPQYQQNGIYYTSVSGGNTTLLNVLNLSLVSNVRYIGAFAVFNLLQNQNQNTNRASALFAYNFTSDITIQLALTSTGGDPKTAFFASVSGTQFIGGDDLNSYSLSGRHLAFGEANYVSRKVRLFTDSSITSVDSTLTGFGNSPSPNASFVSIGGTGPAGENGFYNQSLNNAYIHELILFTTPITDTQRQQIEGYLAWKWGFQASLPSNHPYFRAKP